MEDESMATWAVEFKVGTWCEALVLRHHENHSKIGEVVTKSSVAW